MHLTVFLRKDLFSSLCLSKNKAWYLFGDMLYERKQGKHSPMFSVPHTVCSKIYYILAAEMCLIFFMTPAFF